MTMIILLEVISEEVEVEIEKETSTNNERRCLLQLHLLFGSFFPGRKILHNNNNNNRKEFQNTLAIKLGHGSVGSKRWGHI